MAPTPRGLPVISGSVGLAEETDLKRRNFLKLMGASTAVASFPLSIRRALAIPANHRTGSLADVEHIVFFMQENRSFDHYFGTLRGVRGFGDPHPARLPGGGPVWQQPGPDGPVFPFRPAVTDMGSRFLEDLFHDWNSTHSAWRQGWYDSWVWQKRKAAMAYMTRGDIPFHYALAGAFTVCDAYHCSLLGPTDPNRLYMFSGWVGNSSPILLNRVNSRIIGPNGPMIGDGGKRLQWLTYPEQLEAAGISWKVYQDVGTGLSAKNGWGDDKNPYIGNYGDNALLYFKNFQNAKRGSPLYEKARTGTHVASGGTLFENLQRDIRDGNLPQVSWIVTPEAYSEHPNFPADYGAWYVSQVLDAITANPDVWSKTVMFLMYDENDGFFDHIVPPTAPMGSALGASSVSTEDEIFPGAWALPRGPYGLGIRVPMLVISPWSKGGWVCSEVFDHTSLLRFAERRFGVRSENITPWRRAVCGDLTSTLDFATPDDQRVPLPSTDAYAPRDRKRHPNYEAHPPAEQRIPDQESGTRPARALPYDLHVAPALTATGVQLNLRNSGTATAVLHVRSRVHVPRCYTLGPGASLLGRWETEPDYDLEVHGPNGFYRRITGRLGRFPGEPQLHFDAVQQTVELVLLPTHRHVVTVRNAYTREIETHELHAGSTWRYAWPLAATHGWYDLDLRCTDLPAYRRCFAGHFETGGPSSSDPQLGQRR